MIIFTPLDINEIITAFWARLYNNDAAKIFFNTLKGNGAVLSIDKGAKRSDNFQNPSGTVHVLTAPIDGETQIAYVTVLVNVYVDDTNEGRADYAKLSQAGNIVQGLFHRADLPTHPQGRLTSPELVFNNILVEETLFLPSDVEREHVASTRITLQVKRRND